MTATASPGTTAKAEMLLAAERLREIPGSRTFIVEGSEGRKYATTIFRHSETGVCTCMARGVCSHILSAQLLAEREARDVA